MSATSNQINHYNLKGTRHMSETTWASIPLSSVIRERRSVRTEIKALTI